MQSRAELRVPQANEQTSHFHIRAKSAGITQKPPLAVRADVAQSLDVLPVYAQYLSQHDVTLQLTFDLVSIK